MYISVMEELKIRRVTVALDVAEVCFGASVVRVTPANFWIFIST